MSEAATTPELDFAPDALRQKYRAESDKRVRADAMNNTLR